MEKENKYKRSSGRTFRAKMKALLLCSEGNNVVVICYSNDEADNMFRKIFEIASENANYVKAERHNRRIILPNGKEIHTIGIKQYGDRESYMFKDFVKVDDYIE